MFHNQNKAMVHHRLSLLAPFAAEALASARCSDSSDADAVVICCNDAAAVMTPSLGPYNMKT